MFAVAGYFLSCIKGDIGNERSFQKQSGFMSVLPEPQSIAPLNVKAGVRG